MADAEKTLSDSERQALARVLARGSDPGSSVSLALYGEGQDRTLSFYAEGTRLEARILFPEPPRGEQ